MPNPVRTPIGSGGTAGALAGPGGESDEPSVAHLFQRDPTANSAGDRKRGLRCAGMAAPAGLAGKTIVIGGAPHCWPWRRPPRREPAAPRPRAAAAAARSPTGAPAADPERRHPEPVSAKTCAPQVLLLRLPLSPPELHDRQHPGAERPPHRRRQRRRRNRRELLPQRRRPRTSRPRPLGRHHGRRPAGPNGHYSFRIAPQARRRRAARLRGRLDRAQPQLRLLRLRLPDPRRPRLRRSAPGASARAAPAIPTRART